MPDQANLIRFPVERRHAEPLVDLAGLIDRCGMSERFWRYRIAEGLPAVRWGSRLRFRLSEVERWMEERYS